MDYSSRWSFQRSRKVDIANETRAALQKLSIIPGVEKKLYGQKESTRSSTYIRRDASPDSQRPPYVAFRELSRRPHHKKPQAASQTVQQSKRAAVIVPPFPTPSPPPPTPPPKLQRSGPSIPYQGKGVANKAEEALRRDYQRIYGGNFSLQDYYKIHREYAKCEKFGTEDPQRVLYRRGSLAVYESVKPRQNPVDRVETAYNVAMAQETHYSKREEEPYVYHGRHGRTGADEDFVRYPAIQYDEAEFERMYAERNRHADARDQSRDLHSERVRARTRRHRSEIPPAPAGGPFFDIPPSNRDDKTQYVVAGYSTPPKLKRKTVRGKEIRHVPTAQKPDNGVFNFF